MKKQDKNKFDFAAYTKLSSPEERFRMLDDQYKSAEYLVLSDPFMYRDSGGYDVIKYIQGRSGYGMINPATGKTDKTRPYVWKLRLLVHTNGSSPRPGDRVEWVTQRTNRVMGKKIGTTQARELIRRGDSDKLTETNAAILDKDCCFLVGYEDASQLLSNNGVYFRTGYPISGLPQHFRSGRYYNWRFLEVPPWNDPSDSTPWILKESQDKKKGS
jgi:hypothetical protein